MKITDIQIEKRYRSDLGSLDSLCRSIEEIGLLHPVVVTPDARLIAGQRRLEAYKQLGWQDIPVTIIELEDILKGEHDENACRKDFLPSEMVAIAKALEPVAKEQAKERQESGLKQFSSVKENFLNGNEGQTRDKIAAGLGVSGRTMDPLSFKLNFEFHVAGFQLIQPCIGQRFQDGIENVALLAGSRCCDFSSGVSPVHFEQQSPRLGGIDGDVFRFCGHYFDSPLLVVLVMFSSSFSFLISGGAVSLSSEIRSNFSSSSSDSVLNLSSSSSPCALSLTFRKSSKSLSVGISSSSRSCSSVRIAERIFPRFVMRCSAKSP